MKIKKNNRLHIDLGLDMDTSILNIKSVPACRCLYVSSNTKQHLKFNS